MEKEMKLLSRGDPKAEEYIGGEGKVGMIENKRE